MLVMQIEFYNDEQKDPFDVVNMVDPMQPLTQAEAEILIAHEEKHGCSYGVMTFDDGSQKTYMN